MSASVSACLVPHPESAGDAVSRIEVEARRSARALSLTYLMIGDIARVRLPAARAPERVDGLWKHTCFEAFVRRDGGAYHEVNLSPSTAWATYVFQGYRQERADAPIGPPAIATRRLGDRLELTASMDLAALEGLPSQEDWRLGLSAVVEDESGALSWWALSHPATAPDFHHPASHDLILSAPEAA